MQPDQKQNYWNNEEAQSGNSGEMYQPSDVPDDSVSDDDGYYDNSSEVDDDSLIHWSAEEYVSNEKNSLWFVIFGIVVVGLVALDIFLIKSYTFSVLVVVMAIAVIVLSRRPPRTINYSMSGQGVYIGERLYHFSEYKSFGVLNDAGQHSIMLMPIKRFSPGVTIYFPFEAGEKIVDILGARLPMQELKLDVIDVIVRKLRL